MPQYVTALDKRQPDMYAVFLAWWSGFGEITRMAHQRRTTLILERANAEVKQVKEMTIDNAKQGYNTHGTIELIRRRCSFLAGCQQYEGKHGLGHGETEDKRYV